MVIFGWVGRLCEAGFCCRFSQRAHSSLEPAGAHEEEADLSRNCREERIPRLEEKGGKNTC